MVVNSRTSPPPHASPCTVNLSVPHKKPYSPTIPAKIIHEKTLSYKIYMFYYRKQESGARFPKYIKYEPFQIYIIYEKSDH